MQTVKTDTDKPTRAPSRRVPPWVRWPLIGALAVILVLALALVLFKAARPGVLPGVELAGVDVGGLSQAELETTVSELAEERRAAPLAVTLDDQQVTATAADAGYRFDEATTVDEIWRRGRQGNPLLALGDHVRALMEDTVVTPDVTVDAAALDRWVATTSEQLHREAVEGEIRFDGADVVRSDPMQGVTVDRPELAAQVRTAILDPGGDDLTAPHEVLETITTVAAMDEIAERAELAVSAPVELVRNDGEIVFTPEQIGDLFTIESDLTAGGAEFTITADADEVASTVPDETIAALEAEPRSATFELTSDGMQINPSSDGFAFDPQALTDQLLWASQVGAGDDDTRRAELEGEILVPDRTTEEAEELQIVEPVASFTTNHACCQSRVTNIQRFADIVRGTVVEPGEIISLNGVVGERTREKGFAGGGAIYRGEYVEQVGGGVSQFATTFFNAAYFGGYEIVEHKPHSYYISRYPVGRESTINWPNVDVKVRNDSPYGMYVDTSYTSTSITVTIWGKEWVDVDSETGSRYNIREPETQVEINEDLPEGSERVTQSGGVGFDINVRRTLTFPDGEQETRDFFTRYLPEPRIVERNPADADEAPEEAPDEAVEAA